jgi:hypothetical protein
MSRAKVPIMAASAAEAMSAAVRGIYDLLEHRDENAKAAGGLLWPSALSIRLLMTPQRSPHGT